MVKLAAPQTKTIPSRQSSSSDDSDEDDLPVKKVNNGGTRLFLPIHLQRVFVANLVQKKAATPAATVPVANGNKNKKKESSSSSDSSDDEPKKVVANAKTPTPSQPVKAVLKRKAAPSSSSSSDSDDLAPPANKKQTPTTPAKGTLPLSHHSPASTSLSRFAFQLRPSHLCRKARSKSHHRTPIHPRKTPRRSLLWSKQ